MASSANGEAVGHTFVLSGREVVSTSQMAETITQELGTTIRGFRAPLAPFLALAVAVGKPLGAIGIQPPIHPRMMDFFRKSFVFSQGLSTSLLGFTPSHSFENGVGETARWYEEKGYLL